MVSNAISNESIESSNALVPSKYSVVKGFFEQDDSSTDNDDFDFMKDNFGLVSGTTWSDVTSEVDKLNAKNDNGTQYKLFFFARHGEGYHNIAPDNYSSEEWECVMQEQDGADGIEWYDALLTPDGISETSDLHTFWQNQLSGGAPLPESFYVSPLRRTLQTFNYTWNGLISYSDQIPLVVENAREKYGIGTESKRHPKSYISENYPFANFEDGFTENDKLWTTTKHEKSKHVRYRAELVLDEIFTSDNNTVISVTTHSGTISAFLKIVDHRKWSMKTGEVIPVIIKASKYEPYSKPDVDDAWSTLPSSCATYVADN
ncbi:phosphoglycerate mutase-like protein [Yamadazyma tenuis ATCC 10573]|uniref:Phosphoglycerate mutase-like protein n=2 Tax=Candida tenuis TaxID=2315449 RepID=G3AXH0_CANTC|nr:phosphoglycerate mutase-like protein [Yamadazyma tenuis ATCC 10573]EGV66376.1 phosphoglycerate mutase-like protein [Yamadazyma tenuis ATCC 10573]